MLNISFGPGISAERACYEYLRQKILSGELPPGMPIHQQQVADALGVSRIPVRDALKHLVAEGFLTASGNRHVVTVISPEDIHEIFLMRSALEGLSARVAATRMTDEALAQLMRLGQRMESSDVTSDEWVAYHEEFHKIIQSFCGMPRLQLEMMRLRTAAEHYLRVFFAQYHMGEVRGHEHRQLAEVLQQRDGELAERAMRAHIEAALSEIARAVKEQQTASKAEEVEQRAEPARAAFMSPPRIVPAT
jgi:DNA-binding GntR family transcriptional regulator